MTTTEIGRAVAPAPTAGPTLTFVPADAARPRAGATALTFLREELAASVVDADLVARLIETDPAATVRLLGRANSGARPGERLDTVAQAMQILDRWAVTGLVEELEQDAVPAVPQLWRILARALACERLSGDRRGYTVGLLSGLSELHGLPLEALLESAGVSGAVRVAVTYRRGRLGAALGALLGYLDDDMATVERHGFAPNDVYDAYLEAATTAMTTQAAVSPEESEESEDGACARGPVADSADPAASTVPAALPKQRRYSLRSRRAPGAAAGAAPTDTPDHPDDAATTPAEER